MLQEEDQRKAYLQLMTNFIMETPKKVVKTTYSPTNKGSKEKVKYMISGSSDGRIELSTSGAELFSNLKIGMTESEVFQLSNYICLERGFVLINDMRKRLYMHLDRNAQVWVEFTQKDLSKDPIITKKSHVEAKSTWKIFHNNILKVSTQ